MLCFGAAVVVNYHEDQMAATSVLAQKAAFPSAVAVQSFDPALHSNIIREVHVLAEMRPDQQATLNVGSSQSPRWVNVSPLYPVSVSAMPIAEAHFNDSSETPRRPMARARRMELAGRNAHMASIENTPIAVAIRSANDPISGGAEYISDGRMLSNMIQAYFGKINNIPMGAASATIMLTTVVLITIIVSNVTKKLTQRLT